MMDHRLDHYRSRPAKRLSMALTVYTFATTVLITSAVVLVPAAFIFTARESAPPAGDTIWSCSLPLTMEVVVAIAVALLLSHEASEMGCESRLLTEVFNTLASDDSFGKEPRPWQLARRMAPYLGAVAGIPLACLAALIVVWAIP